MIFDNLAIQQAQRMALGLAISSTHHFYQEIFQQTYQVLIHVGFQPETLPHPLDDKWFYQSVR